MKWCSPPLASAIEMSRGVTWGASALVLLLAIASWQIIESSRPTEIPFDARTKPIQAAPPCPWREPDGDLRQFFPEATRFSKETRILSGLRTELAERLGRTPTAEENVLYLYRIFRDQLPVGAIATRRLKGEHGAIEIVLAVADNGQVRGLRLQRMREPEAIATEIERTEWLNAFRGKSAQDEWRLGGDVPDVPANARNSAQSVVDAVRSLLILMEVASNSGVVTRPHH